MTSEEAAVAVIDTLEALAIPYIVARFHTDDGLA
jgi:hypothetical protein